MKYLGQRPLSSHHGNLPRQKYLFESKIAGVGSLGPNRDLFQERQELSGIAGTTYEPYKRYNHHRLVVSIADKKKFMDLNKLFLGLSTAQLIVRAS